MSKKQLVIQHDLSKLEAPALVQYLRDVSEFIGLDPDLNALDTIWMQNENGPGQSLVVYARRGTAEILRNKIGIEVISLTQANVNGSIIFTATGKEVGRAGCVNPRQEIAIGSKYITGLTGKALDDAIMTASTRALRRLTMQFTTLGLLDESEVKSTVGDISNPAAGAALAGSPMVAPWMPVPMQPANNAPGKDVTTVPCLPAEPVILTDGAMAMAVGASGLIPSLPKVPTMQEMRDEATRFLAAKPDVKPDISPAVPLSTPVESTTSSETVPDKPSAEKLAKPKRARKPKNSVSLGDGGPEAETVARPATEFPTGFPVHEVPALPSPGALSLAPINPNTFAPVVAAVPLSAPVTGVVAGEFAGKPSVEQMADYRKKISVFTSQLPSSENLGSVQKMRAFITKMSGTAPQFMTTDQWEEIAAWFEEFTQRNQIKGLVTYINDALGVK
jgi:hypothetical protein